MSNAIQHGAPDQPVHVRLDGTGDGVLLSVHNAGPPIPANVLPHVFDPFRQGNEPTRSRDGLGLGLFIASEIARAHGGQLRVTSDVEHGTTFELRLPRVSCGEAGA
jgi:signal transduction histidine kinase